jgi:hypothetical protein
MLTLLEPVEPILAATAVPVTFDVTYTVDAGGNGTISIPVSVSSKGIVQLPPAAIPIGTWTLIWDFANLPSDSSTCISNLLELSGFLSVLEQPAQSSSSNSQWTARVTNLLPPLLSLFAASETTPPLPSVPRLANGFGYWAQVGGSDPVHQSLAVTQGRIDGKGPSTSLTVSYKLDPSGEGKNSISVPVYVSFDGSVIVQAPPVALPMTQWTLYWDFTIDSNLSAAIGKFCPGPNFEVMEQQAPPDGAFLSPQGWSATVNNSVPVAGSLSSIGFPEPFCQQTSGVGYYFRIINEGSDAKYPVMFHDPSIAVVQDPIVG